MTTTKTVLIDASNKILGRMASHAAQHALKGDEVIVFNAEKAVVSGNSTTINEKYIAKIKRGSVVKGPFISRIPDKLVRRTIRGMLPWDTTRGREAYRRIKVMIGKPLEIKGNEIDLKKIDASALKNRKYTTIENICKNLGAKWN